MKKWKFVKQSQREEIRLFDVKYKYYINPRNNAEVEVVVLEGNDAVNIIALNSSMDAIMVVKQFRFGIADYTLELPGGLIEIGEDIITAAKRELQEETGYGGGQWKQFGKIAMNPVFQSSYIHHTIALHTREISDKKLDLAEDTHIEWIKISQINTLISQGAFNHPHTTHALNLALIHKFI